MGVQYVNELGQPCTADGQLLDGVQYVNEFGNPCAADGQLLGVAAPMQYGVPMQYGAPMQYAAPPRFNVTPEQFAVLAQGGSLPYEQMEKLLAGTAPSPAEAVTNIAIPETAATTDAEALKEKKPSKKSSKKLSSKKKAKGCC